MEKLTFFNGLETKVLPNFLQDYLDSIPNGHSDKYLKRFETENITIEIIKNSAGVIYSDAAKSYFYDGFFERAILGNPDFIQLGNPDVDQYGEKYFLFIPGPNCRWIKKNEN